MPLDFGPCSCDEAHPTGCEHGVATAPALHGLMRTVPSHPPSATPGLHPRPSCRHTLARRRSAWTNRRRAPCAARCSRREPGSVCKRFWARRWNNQAAIRCSASSFPNGVSSPYCRRIVSRWGSNASAANESPSVTFSISDRIDGMGEIHSLPPELRVFRPAPVAGSAGW